MVISVGSACRVVLSIPGVVVAGCDVDCSIFMIAYCQMQGVCAWAVVGVDVVVNVSACLGIGAVVPSERFTCILIVCIVCAMVDCKIEGVDVCAGRAWLGMVVCVNAANGVILSIPAV